VRHAGAVRCQVRVGAEGNEIVLTVSDDGRLPPGAAFGNGLSGMRSRVEALGGDVTLRPKGDSTVLTVRLPAGERAAEVRPGASLEARATA